MDISNYCADCKNYFLKNGYAEPEKSAALKDI